MEDNVPVSKEVQDYQKKKNLIKSNLKELNDAIENIEKDIEDTFNNLEEENEQYVKKLNHLNMVVKDLENEFMAKQKEEGEQFFNQNEEEETENEENESEFSLYDENLKEECKRLYRKISNIVHPDKAQTNDYIEHFKEAKRLYDDLNYYGLLSLWEKITEESNLDINDDDLENKLIREIEILENELKELNQRYKELTESRNFKIMKAYKAEDEVYQTLAEKEFVDLIFEKLIDLNNKKKAFENALNKENSQG